MGTFHIPDHGFQPLRLLLSEAETCYYLVEGCKGATAAVCAWQEQPGGVVRVHPAGLLGIFYPPPSWQATAQEPTALYSLLLPKAQEMGVDIFWFLIEDVESHAAGIKSRELSKPFENCIPKAFAKWIPAAAAAAVAAAVTPRKIQRSVSLCNVNGIVPWMFSQRRQEASGSLPRALSSRERKGRKLCFVYCLLIKSHAVSCVKGAVWSPRGVRKPLDGTVSTSFSSASYCYLISSLFYCVLGSVLNLKGLLHRSKNLCPENAHSPRAVGSRLAEYPTDMLIRHLETRKAKKQRWFFCLFVFFGFVEKNDMLSSQSIKAFIVETTNVIV